MRTMNVELSNETFEPQGAPIIHALKIHSLQDASASCQCGHWTYTYTGARTKTQIQREFLKHIYRK